MPEWAWKMTQVIAMVLMGASFYFSGNQNMDRTIAALAERVAVNETRVAGNEATLKNESIGYRVLQDEMSRRQTKLETDIGARFDRVESKIDKLYERAARR